MIVSVDEEVYHNAVYIICSMDCKFLQFSSRDGKFSWHSSIIECDMLFACGESYSVTGHDNLVTVTSMISEHK